MCDTTYLSSEIHRTINDIVYGLTTELARAVENKEIRDVDELDRRLYGLVKSHEWVTHPDKAVLFAAVADWEEFKAEHGQEAISPEMLSFFHLTNEAFNSDEYQELQNTLDWQNLENGGTLE